MLRYSGSRYGIHSNQKLRCCMYCALAGAGSARPEAQAVALGCARRIHLYPAAVKLGIMFLYMKLQVGLPCSSNRVPEQGPATQQSQRPCHDRLRAQSSAHFSSICCQQTTPITTNVTSIYCTPLNSHLIQLDPARCHCNAWIASNSVGAADRSHLVLCVVRPGSAPSSQSM